MSHISVTTESENVFGLRSQIMENAEINNIIKILGLQYKKNYSDPESLKSLRYGKIMIMTDQVCVQYLVVVMILNLNSDMSVLL